MTDKTQEQDNAALQEPNSELPDWYLQALVQMVNGKDIEFPITLFAGGLIVSGQLTSGHKYFEGLGVQLKQFFGKSTEHTDDVIKYFTQPAEIYLKDNKKEKTPPPQYIHLREAKVFTPGQQPIPSEGSWWRGRLISIDGFHFGTLSASA